MPALLPPPAKALRLTRRQAHARKARPTPQQANERPRYPELASGVSRVWGAVQSDFAELRAAWFRAVGLTAPAKNVTGMPPDYNAADLDAAIETFLERMAGPKPRGRVEVITAEEGHVQEANWMAYRIGSQRGAEQVGLPTADPELTRLQRVSLADRAFERLSEEGTLRFEMRLDTIKDAMLQGFTDGENPLAIARRLGANLDGYERGRLRQLVRTESAFASERAISDKYREAGVTMYEIVGDPNADSLCTDQIDGGPYALGDEEHMPPYHPNCFCSQVPVVLE